MQNRVNKLWDDICKPKPEVFFDVIDTEKESVPEDNDNDVHVYFVT